MKKTTILIYKDMNDPKKGLMEATQEEWSAIMRANKGLPMCQRRCFIEDCFEDCGVIDRMFIEVPYAKYLVWHKEKMGQERNRVRGKEYVHFSINRDLHGAEGCSIQDTIPAEFDLEESIIGEMVLERLREQLANWKPWALELLDFYLDGKKKTCAKVLGEKYGISAMAMSKRKKLFDEFLRKFFSELV